ncbi:MAG: electron transfer flavoprotein beta subunit/FixA family protein [Gammaproteobacteria bacterium]|nr:MAG: electron transfer flavoprotein beta subunit/FixA family protein [Gammaproteobacteria bacterium]
MGLKIVVTVKQVPDTHNVSGDAMKPDGTVNRGILPAIFNPEDLNALEEAISTKEKVGGTVTAISMGPQKAVEVLKECLYRGADDAILISDRKFAGADTLATSYALKCAIEKIGNTDLIICGRQAIDGDTAQVGPQIAEKMGINQITCVSEIVEVTDETITAKRSIEGGYEIVRSKYPVLLTVTDEINEPRCATVKKSIAYKNIECKQCDFSAYSEPENGKVVPFVKEWNTEVIDADVNMCGLAGSPTKVKAIHSVVLAASEAKDIECSSEGLKALIDELTDEYIIG